MTVAELEILISANTAKLDAGLKDAKGKTKAAGSEMAKGLAEGFNMALGSFSFERIIDGAKDLVRGMVEGNAEMESYTASFKTLLGSVDAAKARMAELADFAAKTPFELPEVVAASKSLQVMGGTALATGRTLTMVGDMASTAKVGYQEMANWVGRLYSALSAGRPFGEAAQRLQEMGVLSGKARNQMEDLSKKGALASEVWRVFTKEADRSKGAMAEQSKTLEGLASTLKDDFMATLREVGKPVFDAVKEAVKGAIALFGNPDFKGAAKVAAGIAAGLAAIIGTVAGIAAALMAWGKVAAAFSMVGEAIGGVSGALAVLSGPVGWVIAAAGLIYAAWRTNFLGIRDFVAKVVGEIVGWWQDNLPLILKTTQTVLAWIKSAWATLLPYLKRAWGGIVSVINVAWVAIKGIVLTAMRLVGGIISAVMLAINGRWADAWEMLKQTVVRAWATIAATVVRTIGAILGAVDRFGDAVAGAFGMKFTGLDGAQAALEGYGKYWDGVGDAAASAQKKIAGSVKALSVPVPKDVIGGKVVRGDKINWDGGALAGLAGVRMGGDKDGGGKGRAPALSAGQKAENAQVREYIDLIHETRRALRLKGDATASAALADRIAHGEVKDGAAWYAQEAVALLKRKEAMDANLEATKRMNEAMADAQKRLLALSAVGDADRLSIDVFGKRFAALADKNKAKIAELSKAMADAKAKEDRASAYQATVQSVKATMAAMTEEIDLWGKKTRAEKTAYEMSKAAYRDVPVWVKAAVIAQAEHLDKLEATAAAAERVAEAERRWADLMRRDDEPEIDPNGVGATYEKFQQFVEGLKGPQSELQKVKALMADLAKEGRSDLADRVWSKWLSAEKARAFGAEMDRIKETVEDGFMDMFDRLWQDGFRNFFGNVVGGFRSMIAQVAQEWIRSQIANLISRGLTAVINGTGGAKGLFGRAVGGPVLANTPYLVGENGPELFVPSGGGRIVTNQAMKGRGGGPQITVHVHGVKDAGSFLQSESQVHAMMFRAGMQAAKATG